MINLDFIISYNFFLCVSLGICLFVAGQWIYNILRKDAKAGEPQ